MSETETIEWPREIWMAERDEHDQGVVHAVLSEWATVARWVSDAREAVFAGTRKRMMKDLDLGSATFASLMGKVATQLEVTLTSFLDEGT